MAEGSERSQATATTNSYTEQAQAAHGVTWDPGPGPSLSLSHLCTLTHSLTLSFLFLSFFSSSDVEQYFCHDLAIYHLSISCAVPKCSCLSHDFQPLHGPPTLVRDNLLGVHHNISATPQECQSRHTDLICLWEVGHFTYDLCEEVGEGDKECESATSCQVGSSECGAREVALVVGGSGWRQQERHEHQLVELAARQDAKVPDGGPLIEYNGSIFLQRGTAGRAEACSR